MVRTRTRTPSNWCQAPGCKNGCSDKPFCIEHILLIPYAAGVRRFIEDGLAEQCDRLLTDLKFKGPQNLTKWREEVVHALVRDGVVVVVDVPYRRKLKKMIFMKESK